MTTFSYVLISNNESSQAFNNSGR